MTIHTDHPFPTDDDPARRLRGRLGGAATLWTAGAGRDRAGLTVTSVLLAHGEPPRLVALLDPDSDLAASLEQTGRAVVHLLSWRHRDLADAFAGAAPAPGGPFTLGSWVSTLWGPRLADAATYAAVEVETAATVGWSWQVTCAVVDLEVGDDEDPLLHRRGRYLRLGSGA